MGGVPSEGSGDGFAVAGGTAMASFFLKNLPPAWETRTLQTHKGCGTHILESPKRNQTKQTEEKGVPPVNAPKLCPE